MWIHEKPKSKYLDNETLFFLQIKNLLIRIWYDKKLHFKGGNLKAFNDSFSDFNSV